MTVGSAGAGDGLPAPPAIDMKENDIVNWVEECVERRENLTAIYLQIAERNFQGTNPLVAPLAF